MPQKIMTDDFCWRALQTSGVTAHPWDSGAFDWFHTDWRTLEKKSYRPRDWEIEPLEWFQDLLSGRLHGALPLLSAMPTHPWKSDAADIKNMYGDIDSPNHSFGAEPLDWGFRLTEPQITKGWEYFLNEQGSGSDGHRRRAALLITLSDLSDTFFCKSEELSDYKITAKAEHHFTVPSPKTRASRFIDLLIEWTNTDTTTQVAAIEFKLEHHVTLGQLSDTEKHMHTRPNTKNRVLFLIVPSIKSHRRATRKNRDWHLVSWHAFLRRYEINLEAAQTGNHNGEFQRFRRTVFNRTTSSKHA